MAKTLLQIVKNALESMDSDPVDAIFLTSGGTEESEQIASFASQLFEYMHNIYDWPYTKFLTKLDSVGDSEKPNYLRIPNTVAEVIWVKYREQDVQWLTPEEFIEVTNARNAISTDSSGVAVSTLDSNTVAIKSFDDINLYIRTDRNPTYYTSFDDEYLVFDSYDSINESTLQQSQNVIYGVKASAFSLEDNFIPDFPDKMYPFFQAELNRECHLRLKQVDSPVDSKRALASIAHQRTRANRVNKKRITGFGRK